MGGGLAGLALAAELSALEFSHLSIIVIEPRDEYLRDKTWSYWRPNQQDNVPHDFSDCESATWPAWCVKDATNSVSIDSSKAENYVYASIASDALPFGTTHPTTGILFDEKSLIAALTGR